MAECTEASETGLGYIPAVGTDRTSYGWFHCRAMGRTRKLAAHTY